MQGRFIVLEGPDGAGKTTQAARLMNYISSRGINVEAAIDPGTTPLGNLIRPLVKNTDIYPKELSTIEQFLLFGAAKVALKYEVIIPARAAGRWLVADRFNLGGFAYQGYTEDSVAQWQYWMRMEDLMLPVMRDVWPDLTIILDVHPEVGLTRRAQSKGDGTRFEEKGIPFYEKVRKGYQYYRDLPGVITIDADRPEDEVFADICTEVDKLF